MLSLIPRTLIYRLKMEVKNNKKNVSMEQKKFLLECIKKNPQVMTGKFSNTFTQKDAQEVWCNITKILNSCGNGANKDWKSWRKTWQDIRCRSKSKNSQYRKHHNSTRGGPFIDNPTSSYEKDVLDTISAVSLNGHTNILESATDFNYLIECEKQNDGYGETSQILESSEVTNALNSPTVSNLLPSETTQNTSESLSFKKNTFPRAQRKKLVFASEASENYRVSLEKKNSIKEKYYEKKIKILDTISASKERSATARERSAAAEERSAKAAEQIAYQISCLVEAAKEFQDAIC